MATKDLFNTGKLTTTGIDEQYNDKFWSKGAIRESQRVRTFTQLGDRLTQPKNFGDEIVKERQFPILHPMNRLDGGIDATTATLVLQSFYAYTSAGALAGTFEARDYANGATGANAAAVTAAGVGGTVRNGAGSLYNGDADYSVISGTFPSLSEEGGNVNGVNTKSVTVRGKVSEFGLHLKFTQKSIDMDSRTGVLAMKAKALGEAKGDIYEQQVQADLITASELNRTFAGTVATTLGTCAATAALTYADLRLMEQELKRLLVPRDTKIISGSTKIGTSVIGSSYYVYVGQELLPTLEDMQHNSVNVWRPIESYKDAAGTNVANGEVGAIGRFRFIEVANMIKYRGVGMVDSGDVADIASYVNGAVYAVGDVVDNAGDGVAYAICTVAGTAVGATALVATGATFVAYVPVSATGYHVSNKPGTVVSAFDVFPVLFVGSDSFATVGFEGDSAQIMTAMPKADANLDPFGKNGSMSIAWYFGTLIYKAERIRQIACVAKL